MVGRVTDPTPAATRAGGGVRTVPMLSAVVRVLPLWLAWLLVVVLGRVVCRMAQRIPLVVRLVRHLRDNAADV